MQLFRTPGGTVSALPRNNNKQDVFVCSATARPSAGRASGGGRGGRGGRGNRPDAPPRNRRPGDFAPRRPAPQVREEPEVERKQPQAVIVEDGPPSAAVLRTLKGDFVWRLFQLTVPASNDPGKVCVPSVHHTNMQADDPQRHMAPHPVAPCTPQDSMRVCEALRKGCEARLGCKKPLPYAAIRLVRKSFDSRKRKQW